MALSAAQMQEAVIKNLPAKTGKSLEEWIAVAQSLNLVKSKEVLLKLKADFGLGHVQAQTIVWRMDGSKPYIETQGYEEGIFQSAATLSIYQTLKKNILQLHPEVHVKPCKTYIPFYRKTQFAILTEKKGEVILGLNLDEAEFPELAAAVKIGGSDRINKMLVVNTTSFKHIQHILEAAINRN